MIRIFNMKLPLFFDYRYLDLGSKVPIGIDFDIHPSGLIVGSTGSGKSFALALMAARISLYLSEARLVICDFKNASFAFLAGLSGYYGYTAAVEGIVRVYEEMQTRLALNDESRNRRKIFLLVDEYAALVMFLPKKEADNVKQMVASILMLGRSLGVHLLIGMQRADSEFFRSGARDQFGMILALGNLSKEQQGMLFPDHRDQLRSVVNQRGEGFLLLDGKGLYRIRVPTVRDPARLHRLIASRLWDGDPEDGSEGEA